MTRKLLAAALLASLGASQAFAQTAVGTPIYFTAAAAGSVTAGNTVRTTANIAQEARTSPVEKPIYFYANSATAETYLHQHKVASAGNGSNIPAVSLPIYFPGVRG